MQLKRSSTQLDRMAMAASPFTHAESKAVSPPMCSTVPSGLSSLTKMAPAPQIEWGTTGRISNFLLGASIPSGFWWIRFSCPSYYFTLSPLVRTVLRPTIISTLSRGTLWRFTTGIFSQSPDTPNMTEVPMQWIDAVLRRYLF